MYLRYQSERSSYISLIGLYISHEYVASQYLFFDIHHNMSTFLKVVSVGLKL